MTSSDSSTDRSSTSAVMATGHLSGEPIIKAPPLRSVGVVGLGHMGNAFALNLVADGYRVLAYDRDPAHVEALRAAGAEGASNLADLAACDAVLTSLPDDGALTAVALHPEGLAHVMQRGAVHISMSSVSPGLSRRLVTEHEARGQGYVAAPVLGNPDLARVRHLFVLALLGSTFLSIAATGFVMHWLTQSSEPPERRSASGGTPGGPIMSNAIEHV
jgi:hypothetical protein